MTSSSLPASGASTPKRLSAMGGAVVVTALTLAGALGYGPGAALGSSPSAMDSARQPSTAGPADGSPAVGGERDDWLTITDRPEATGGRHDSASRGTKSAREPAVPPRSGHGKRIVYDISKQRVWLVTRTDQSRAYLVSGGTDEDLLDPGRYAVYSKSRHAVSFDSKETMNYMVRFATGERSAIGFHDIPAYADGTLAQSRSDLGTPQSAGCIRQWITDAKALWEFSDLETPVVVTA